ncbi:hypothetical protein BN7_1678 [Wickerhamomyces ciferrii]|uniref:Uncharacterized protein n=1 Tax=Wickerhamomyces ciferrii (strain ATCC 14091 / BCRC 22168 / CBS 111 / JCM 3599 / NBRC 0793 / NRRL Y-1031 F-60-10) TaxID=1206466 RepID=K0KL24_WICCF|nr:uncharacterized protein BN7_1678 [Wickerhamomyces ciferrii]CCH42134.1 hypothetical protein BN7_1678 [Wickerhamomyces ciferrii]
MGRKKKSAREKRLDNFRSNRSNYLDSTENKKKEMGHKDDDNDDDDKVKRRKVPEPTDKQNDQGSHGTSQKLDEKFSMFNFVSDNKEKLKQNVESEMIKSSIDIDIRNFYRGFEPETIENIKKKILWLH